MNIALQDLLDSDVRDWYCQRCRRAVMYNPELALDEISVRGEREFTTIMMTEIKLL